jgi:hypothetical protein
MPSASSDSASSDSNHGKIYHGINTLYRFST